MRGWATLAVVIGLLVACGADDVDDEGASASAPAVPVAESDLAPSQVSASTVAGPVAPPPCDVAALSFSAPHASAIRIRNDAAMQCEVDVFESELADPLMEPDVWLDPGAEAEVLVEDPGASCAAPSAITSIELVVNDRSVEVPIAISATCGVALSAIYQVEPAG